MIEILMSKVWRVLVLLSLVFLLASCQQPAPKVVEKPIVVEPTIERPSPEGPRGNFTQAQADECAKKNGEMSRGFAGFTCVIKTSDAGKSCTSSSQCESHCLAKGGGICAPAKPFFGCFQTLENGQTPTLCVD